MKLFNEILSRSTALVLLVAFTFISCSGPAGGEKPGEAPVVITPGEGNPRYVYLDNDGNVAEEDTYGRTGLFVEDNKNAEGVLIVSDKVSSEDRVSVYNQNNNSTVSMFFKSGSNFPYYMIIKQNEEIYYAHLTYYRTATSTYDIIFEKDGDYSPVTNLVLNQDIFTVYEDDPELTDSQNLRLRNITIALGLWGSLYNALDEPEAVQLARWGWLKSAVSAVKSVFKAVAVIATVVAVVVAPVVAFFNPALGLALHETMLLVAEVSAKVVLGLSLLEQILDDPSSSPPVAEVYVPVINVKNCYEGTYITNGVEFHIGKGKDVLLEFCSPGADFANITLANVFNDVLGGYEPGNPFFPYPAVSDYFTVSLEKDDMPPDRFLIRIKRKLATGTTADGKVAYGFVFGENEEDIHINGSVQPVEYKYSYEEHPRTRRDLVVVRFCIDPECPDYRDE